MNRKSTDSTRSRQFLLASLLKRAIPRPIAALRPLAGALAATLAAGCIISLTDSDGNLDVEVSEAFSYQVDAAALDHLSLEGINGVVTVRGDLGTSLARVTGTRTVRSDSRGEAERFLDRVSVEVLERGDAVTVRTIQPDDTRRHVVTVDYDVTIPADMTVEIANINGEVEVRSLDAPVEVDVVNGTVRVLDVVGDVEIALVNGEVTCDVTLTPNGLLDVSVVNGEISVTVPASSSALLAADVATGTITVAGLTLQEATTSTRSVHGRLGAGAGQIRVELVNGTIAVRGR